MHVAASEELSGDAVRRLASAGADPNAPGLNGMTALMSAHVQDSTPTASEGEQRLFERVACSQQAGLTK